MVKSYTKMISLKKIPFVKNEYSEIVHLKIAEAIDAIQEQGGTIISSTLLPNGEVIYLFYVLYEDNGNFEAIDQILRKKIFNFDKLWKE